MRPYLNAPRTLDLDVLLYGQARIDSQVTDDQEPKLVITIEPGEPIRLRNVTVRIEGPASEMKAFRVPDSKALRAGEATIADSYAEVRGGEVWLVNANIPEYSHGNRLNHEPRRPRKLLLHEREIEKFVGAVERKGMTLVPLMVYFNSTGRAKVELALAKGKQTHDKRASTKERDWKRDKARLMRDRG